MDISKIKPYEKNAKKHTKKQIEQVANSITRFGFNQPIVVDKQGTIIVGHGRYEASKLLKLVDVPVIEVDLTEEESKAYRLADNKLNESEWEMGLVIDELKGLSQEMVELTGFNDKLDFGNNENDWNYNYKNEEQHGDGLVEKLGFAPHSMWYGIPRDYGEIKEKLIKLPTRRNKNPHQDKYSRTNPESIRRIIKMYMREGDRFLENCCGWSTFGAIAKHEGYSGVGIDIWDVALEKSRKQIEAMTGRGVVDIFEMDGMKTSFNNGEFDYVYCNPPFMDVELYSGKDNDIAGKTLEDFKNNLVILMSENRRVLKKGGICTMTISDRRKGGILQPFQMYIIEAGLASGFLLHDFVIVEQLGVANMYRKKAYEKKRSPKNHEYVISFINH